MKNFVKPAIAAAIVLILAIGMTACTNQMPEYEPVVEYEPVPEPTPKPEPAPASTAAVSFPFPFSADELRGNTVTEADLGVREVFFVYYWTTWCPTCVNSMPGLIELAEEFAGEVGFITLLGDFDTAREVAIRITEDAPFYTMNARDGDFQGLVQLIRPDRIPTSVIIDGDGNIIGGQIVGGGTDRFRAAIEYALGR